MRYALEAYGQNRKDRQMMIDACNVEMWYGTA
jgi:hypothetical protein